MVDQRFFKAEGPFTVQQIAALSGSQIWGSDEAQKSAAGTVLVSNIAPLNLAEKGDLSFFDNKKYLDAFAATKASVCFVSEKFADKGPKDCVMLVSKEPYKSYALAAQAFYPRSVSTGQISDRAFIDPSAKIGKNCQIGPFAVVEAGAEIGDNTIIHSNAVIGQNVKIGASCEIGACATVYYAIMGDFTKLHPGVRIGQDGFGFAIDPKGHIKIPQVGRVLIGSHVEIGANTAIDRGALDDTVIEDHVMIDDLVMIGHNVKVGRGSIMAGQVGLSGSSQLGQLVVMGGQSATVGHIKVGNFTRVAGQSAIMRDCPDFSELCGSPAVPVKQFFREMATISRLAKPKAGKAGKVDEAETASE